MKRLTNKNVNRRSFLKRGVIAGIVTGGGLFASQTKLFASTIDKITSYDWQITVNGVLVQEGNFPTVQQNILVEVPNGTAHIIIEPDRIRIPQSNHICEKKICSLVGSIQNSGESITCLPNKLVVRIL